MRFYSAWLGRYDAGHWMNWKNQLSSQYKNTLFSNIHRATLDRTLPFTHMTVVVLSGVGCYFLFRYQRVCDHFLRRNLCLYDQQKVFFIFPFWPVQGSSQQSDQQYFLRERETRFCTHTFLVFFLVGVYIYFEFYIQDIIFIFTLFFLAAGNGPYCFSNLLDSSKRA